MTVFWFDLEGVRSRLYQAVARLAMRHPEIVEVWLFGSVARGEAVPGSDADLLIVVDDCPLPFVERSSHYQPDFCGVGVDVLVYTAAELARMESEGHAFLRSLKEARVCLYRRASGTSAG